MVDGWEDIRPETGAVKGGGRKRWESGRGIVQDETSGSMSCSRSFSPLLLIFVWPIFPLSPPTTLASEVFSPLGGSALPPLALFGCSHASDRPAVLCGASGVSPRLGFLGCCRGNGCGRRPQ